MEREDKSFFLKHFPSCYDNIFTVMNKYFEANLHRVFNFLNKIIKMTNWNRIETTQLIMLYEQQPVLYNSQCEDALDRIKKVDAIKSITEELKIYRPGATPEEVKSKIKTLRNQYIRERNSIVKSKKSGAGLQDVYTPKLWCYEELNFLDKFLKSTPSISNIPHGNSLNNEESLLNETFEDEVHQECREKKRKTGLDVQITRSLQVAEEMANHMRSQKQTKRSKAYNLGKFVEQELEDIPEDLFMDSKWKIINVVREVQEKCILRKKQNTSSPLLSDTQTQNTFSDSHAQNISLLYQDNHTTFSSPNLNTQKRKYIQSKPTYIHSNLQAPTPLSCTDAQSSFETLDFNFQETYLPTDVTTQTPNTLTTLLSSSQKQTSNQVTYKPKTTFQHPNSQTETPPYSDTQSTFQTQDFNFQETYLPNNITTQKPNITATLLSSSKKQTSNQVTYKPKTTFQHPNSHFTPANIRKQTSNSNSTQLFNSQNRTHVNVPTTYTPKASKPITMFIKSQPPNA